ncbi:hypothetical protein [Ruegeria atlantica]|uniref:hypothetical protein n=1 Tax=Ruegeria atlantica TaxID=81569 RepID=UPI00147AE265|nr:hypothetical protein [Ruegeria atlantica]
MPQRRFNINSVKPKLAGAAFIVALMFAVFHLPRAAISQTSPAEALTAALTEMGYSQIAIDSCVLTFERAIEPSEANNGLYKYERFINLKTIDFSSGYEVIERSTERGPLFVVLMPLNDLYYDIEPELLRFRLWAKKEFPASNWPFHFSSRQGAETPMIEMEIWKQVPGISNLNRWKNYTKFGSSTGIPPEFRMTYFRQEDLEKFMLSFIEYASFADCKAPTE